MIDPITAITAATAAFNGVKKLVQAGRDIEDVSGQIGKWFSAVSDFNHARSEAENPSQLKKFMAPQSIEQQALDIVINKKKIQEMEAELATMIKWRYGGTVYEDMIRMRRKLRAQREKEVYAKLRRRKQIRDAIIGLSIASVGLYLVYLLIDIGMNMHREKIEKQEPSALIESMADKNKN